MEQEIDLRPYLQAIFRRWVLIVTIVGITVFAALAITLFQPRTYKATADILLTTPRSRIQFEDRFTTIDSSDLIRADAQRRAITDLALSGAVESDVLAKLPSEFQDEDLQPGIVAQRFRIETVGDLVQITVNDTDQARGKLLAQLWAESYLKLINEIYAPDNQMITDIEQQYEGARERYNKSQSELEEFIGTSELVRLEQRIDELEGLLKGSQEANQRVYQQYLERAADLDAILNDARTLSRQVAANESSDLANGLASLALRARVVGNQLPIDLRFDDPTAILQSGSVSLADIEALISALEQRRQEMVIAAQELASVIASGGNSSVGLPADVRTKYEIDLDQFRQQLEQQKARQKFLEQQRDIAFESLTILQRKLDEQRIAQGTNESVARLVGVTLERSSRLTPLVVNTGAALFVSLIAALGLVAFLEIYAAQKMGRKTQPEEPSLENPAPGSLL